MNKPGGLRRPSNATVLSLAALIVATWGVFVRGTGASPKEIAKVVAEKSDCPPNANVCGVISNSAVTAVKLAQDSVNGNKIKDRTVSGQDVGKLELRNVNEVFPSVIGTTDGKTAQNNQNIYFGDEGSVPHDPDDTVGGSHNDNFEVLNATSGWKDCDGVGDAAGAACLKVPATGKYSITVRAVWEANLTGKRVIGIENLGKPCDATPASGYKALAYEHHDATTLPTLTDNRQVDLVTLTVELEQGQCLAPSATHTANDDLTFDFSFAATMQ